MHSTQATQQENKATQPAPAVLKQVEAAKLQSPATKPSTFAQRLADKMASKVGSWAFLIGQSTVLAGWIGCNLMPGVPHWDEQPFILLNLVFSFASAYTAPVVLMSQNRQSEEDREHASHNYQITLQAAQNIELLHEKLDSQYTQKLDELSALIQQQQATNEVKIIFVPAQPVNGDEVKSQTTAIAPFSVRHQPKKVSLVNANGQSLASELDLNNIEVTIHG